LKKDIEAWLEGVHDTMLSIDYPTFRPMMLDFIEDSTANLVRRPLPKTKEEWLSRRDVLKINLLKSLGLDPYPERTNLNVQRLGVVRRGGYRIEKVTFEPRHGFKVPAHLYVPENTVFPVPGILLACGHWLENGKTEPDIQACCISLAKLGFVVLVFDPIGQGERGPRWRDHGHLETLLVGLSQAGLAVWEHIRALDFLSSLKEVDPNRIGMTGASGGGLYTVYASAIDERVRVMVPVCYVTSFLPFLKSMRGANWNGGIDLCNQVPNIISYADMFDIVGLFAPRPLSIITATRDPQFTPEAAKDVFQKAATIYGFYGLKDSMALFEVDSVHGYDQKMREAAYGWFMRWLMGKGNGSPIQEPKLTVEHPRSPEIRCLRKPTYQGSAITRLVASLAEKCKYPVPEKRAELIKYQLTLRSNLRKLLGDFPPKNDLQVRVTSRGQFTKFDIERVILMSEPTIQVPAFMILPKNLQSPESIVLYLDDEKDECLRNGLAEYFVSKNMGILGVDVRGTGDTKYAEEFELATDSLMLARSLIGQRIWDVVRSIDFLYERFPQKRIKIGILGNGVPGLLAILSAALDDRIHFTIANQTLLSFKSLVLERQTFPASLFLFDILKFFDLPQIAIALAPRPLAISNPVNGLGYPVFQERLEHEFGCTRSAYEKFEAEDNFNAVAVSMREGKEKLEKWLENRLFLTRREAKVYLGSISQSETTVTALAKLLDSRGPNVKRVVSKLVEKELLVSSRAREQRYIPISLPEALTVAKTFLRKELETCLTVPLTEVVEKTRKH